MDMDMDMDMGGSTCSTHMLWNWDTIDSCFLAESWHIKNEGMMAATCIGVFLLAIVLEFVRRAGKEYDQFVLRQFQQHVNAQAAMSRVENDCCAEEPQPSSHTTTFRATPVQQLVRSLIHAVAFGIAYILMLIAMAYNGYVIIMIIIGAGFGKFVCDWTSQKVVVGANTALLAKGVESNEEATVCCG
ncbi:ctr copper transporter [Xylariaceae sp. AK1471]|nr:ctr copper transporter [Xylariaceae sp. AK1471]